VLLKPDGFEAGAGWPLIVLLHGYGTSMYDLLGLGEEIDGTGYVYAFPNAPIAIPIGPGHYGYSWVAREGVATAPPDAAGLDEQIDILLEELKQHTGAGDGQIVLGGFSQGGGVTLRYGLPRPDLFAGLACLSGSFRDAESLRHLLPAERKQPIFLAHGRYDPMVPLERGRGTRTFLEAEGYAPVYREYDMAHQISADELDDLDDLRSWLRDVLPAKQA
jgi:phospholipase/carboxylesterase